MVIRSERETPNVPSRFLYLYVSLAALTGCYSPPPFLHTKVLYAQRLPQLRTSMGGMHAVNESGVGFVPRPRATEMQQSTPLAITTINHEENASSQQPSGQRNPEITSGLATHISQATLTTSDSLSHSAEPGVQVVPSLVTAAPGTHGHLHGLRRVQQVASGQLERNVIQAFGGEQPSGVHTQPQPISESSVHQNNERHGHGNSTHAYFSPS